jgi:hypothetical protein
MSNEQTQAPEFTQGGVISIEQATAETKRWRDQYSAQFGGDTNLIKAFFIPMHDVKCLLEFYEKFRPTGVRAYIGVRETGVIGNSPLSLLLVPATEKEDFWNKGPHPSGAGAGSSIYDFTTPCPDTCAGTNPLNS